LIYFTALLNDKKIEKRQKIWFILKK
jgi:hypothetical protein